MTQLGRSSVGWEGDPAGPCRAEVPQQKCSWARVPRDLPQPGVGPSATSRAPSTNPFNSELHQRQDASPSANPGNLLTRRADTLASRAWLRLGPGEQIPLPSSWRLMLPGQTKNQGAEWPRFLTAHYLYTLLETQKGVF